MPQKCDNPKYIVVIRSRDRKGNWSTEHVWRSSTRQSMCNRMRAWTNKIERKLLRWPEKADQYVLDNYYRISTTQIAKHLRSDFKQNFTKSAVISRYHTLKGTNYGH